MKKRGIVISPPFELCQCGGVSFGGDPDPLELRKYLTYWDKIDYPTTNLIHVHSNEIDFLANAQAVKRSQINFQSVGGEHGIAKMFVAAQESAYQINEQAEPGCWDIAQLSQSPFYTSNNSRAMVDFELYGMLPVPSINTPFEDILEFKARRNDELLAFRGYLDEIYLAIVGAKDINRAKQAEVRKLQDAISAVDRVMSENGIKKTVTNLRNTLNTHFSEAILAGVGSAGLSAFSAIHMTPLLAGMAGAGLVIAHKTIQSGGSNTIPAHLNYLSSMRKAFIEG